MNNGDPIRLFADDMTIASQYWETVKRTNYSQPERELMLAVLKDALLIYKKRIHSRNRLFREAESWFFNRDTNRLFSFETVCAVLGLSPEKIRQNLLAWKLHGLSDGAVERQEPPHARKPNIRQRNVRSTFDSFGLSRLS
jgi:hypothetical protein